MARASIHGAQGPAIFAAWRPFGALELARRAYGILMTWQSRTSDRSHLSGLDDRLLKDMGLTHADVQQEVSKAFWQA